MGIAQAQAMNAPRPARARCETGLWIEGLSDELRAGAIQLLADPAWTTKALKLTFADDGYRLSAHSLARHRRGDCSCGNS